MNKAIILIPENVNEQHPVEVTTNGIHLYHILNSMQSLVKGISRQLSEEAKRMVGDDPKKMEEYLDKMIATYVKSKDRNLSGRDLLFDN